MSTRVVLVNMEYPPLVGPGVWRVLALSRDLAALGFEVTVVCSDRSTWHDKRDVSLLERIPPEIRVLRLHAPLLDDWQAALERRARASRTAIGRSVWTKLRVAVTRWIPDAAIGWAWQAARTVRREIASSGGDVTLITSGPQHVSHLVGLWNKRRARCRWVMDYRDPWTTDALHVRSGPYQGRLFRWLERRCLATCDVVVSVSTAWRNELLEIARGAGISDLDGRVHLLPNGHDLDPERIARWQSLKLPSDRLAIHFSGTVQQGTRNAADLLFAALRAVRDRVPRDRWPIVTFTGLPERVQAQVRSYGLEELVKDVGYRSQDEALAMAATVDVLLVLVDHVGYSREGVIPAKTYEALALGAHVLAIVPGEGDVAHLLRNRKHATVCGTPDVEAVTAALLSLIEQHARDPEGMRATEVERAAAQERFSRRAIAQPYADLILATPSRRA
jgi:glycosyltransferase involved in cell wall biosynthesis